ncbi:MAG TPA: carboxypeptidase regulatory-like domain-containing protein [Gemmatimonadaceae bacterium]
MAQTRSFLAVLALLFFAVSLPSFTLAQTTTGGISGSVAGGDQGHLIGAQVQIHNASTGFTRTVITDDAGRYFITGLEIGTYDITARRLGFVPDTKPLKVELGQTARLDFLLTAQASQLSEVLVTGHTSADLISPTRMGAQTTLTDSALRRTPSLNRNFTDFVGASPQVSQKGPGNSGGGQNNRFNAIQIDGSLANDVFGLSSTLQPGGQAGAKQISLEAIKEYQILLSPFDVRQGYFSGFMVNAVTKSGSNTLHGTGTYAVRNEKLERNVDYLRAAPFSQKQEGFWLGGPIIKDKVFFSVAPEFQQESAPASGPYIGQPAGATVPPAATQAAVDSFTNILKTKYGYADPGTAGLVTNTNPLANMFARLDFISLPHDSRLVTRYNYVKAQQDILSRSATRLGLSNNGYNFQSVTNSYLGQLFTSFNHGISNEALVGYTRIRDARLLPIFAPFVVISRVSKPGGGTGQVAAGSENSSQGNELDQDITEITDNITIPMGSHRVTIGTKNEFYKVRNLFSQNSLGNYTFGTLDSLINNTPATTTLGIKLDNTDGAARFTARTLGFYAQDEWQPTTNLNVSLGLRLDMPGLRNHPDSNATIQSALGINTTQVPTSAKQWSPRIGFNWDVTGDQVNQLRGGTGYFMSQPAYVWLSNLFGNSGVNGYGNLTCNNSPGLLAPQMPNAGTPNATNCKNATAVPSITVNTVDPNLKFPETWRSTLGYDRVLPGNIVGTIEGIYTRSVYNFYYQNIGVVDNPIGTDRNGRSLYGDITSATSNVVVSRKPIPGTTRFLGDVIALTNTKTKDYSYSFTTQMVKRFSNSFEGSAAYTYARSYDVWDLTSSVAFSNWAFGRSYSGRQDDQTLYPSKWDVPHKVVFNGSYTFKTKTDVSLFFIGESGVPYEYVYGSDMNGDNGTANDLVYVPKDAHDPTEIQFVTNGNLTPAMQQDSVEAFITSHECLNSQRGTIMQRNSCRTPWTKLVNFSARQSIPTLSGHNVILQLDVFNFLNLLNKNWGPQLLGSSNSPTLFTRVGWVQPTAGQPLKLASGAQPTFRYTPFQQFSTTNASSNYALQLQLKYTF